VKFNEVVKIFTVEEVSEILKVTTLTLRRYLRSGELKGSKIGGQWRISQEQINDFLDKNSNEHMTKG